MGQIPLTVVSNRLPVRLTRSGEEWRAVRSDGGLVGALEPVLRRRGGTWVGWSGSTGAHAPQADDALATHGHTRGFRLQSVMLSARESDSFYEGACNQALWPLLHGFTARSRLRKSYGPVYREVNRRFAEVVASVAGAGTVWVHDYHLLQMGTVLRKLLPHARLGFFFHTPFPRPEVMLRLQWGPELLASLACFDLIGFQTEDDRRNFHGWMGALHWVGSDRSLGAQRELESRTAVFPISVDWQEFHEGAAAPSVLARARAIRAELEGKHILLGVDRLDYTKGIPERLVAYERLLEREPRLRERVVFVQLAIPSRTAIDEYARTRGAVEATVARVNARFGVDGWTPVRYVYGTWDREELLAWYVAADVAVVTPVRDGMNLVAKEFVAASRGEGVLVLSPGAGASRQLGEGALLAEPHDTEKLAAKMSAALDMPAEERRNRLHRLQTQLRSNDVHHWAESFLDKLGAIDPPPSLRWESAARRASPLTLAAAAPWR